MSVPISIEGDRSDPMMNTYSAHIDTKSPRMNRKAKRAAVWYVGSAAEAGREFARPSTLTPLERACDVLFRP
jgi:hypothetical protein